MERPVWDKDKLELWYNGVLIKKLNRNSTNQFIVLSAFQEDGWPKSILSPIAPTYKWTERDVIHNVVSSLNASIRSSLIRFFADSANSSIGWETCNK